MSEPEENYQIGKAVSCLAGEPQTKPGFKFRPFIATIKTDIIYVQTIPEKKIFVCSSKDITMEIFEKGFTKKIEGATNG